MAIRGRLRPAGGGVAGYVFDSRKGCGYALQGLALCLYTQEDLPSKDEVRQVGQGVLDHQVQEITESGGKVEDAHLRLGRPAEEILRLSEEIIAGLIAVSNQGLSGRFSRMKRFVMGSVSENVARYARCSVMVARKDLYDRPAP